VGSGNERVLILAATNRPGELDDAALRRFPRRIYIRMPDANARLTLLRALLDKNTKHTLSENDMQKIASRTEGYSASDLKELAKESALQPIRDIDSTKLRTVSPQSIRPINLGDFIHSLNNVKPSVDPSSLAAYEKWNSQFGESANENRSASTDATRSSMGKLFSNPLSLM
ncbi:spastin, partial [Paragonimus westermani]